MRGMGLSLAVLLMGCGSPASFEEQSADIQSAEAVGVNLIIKARQQMVFESLAMAQIGALVEDIARGIQDGLPGPTEQTQFVQLQLGYAAVDRLGNEATIDFGTIRFSLADLRAANLDNLVGVQLLELADDVSPSAGIDPAIDYCSDLENATTNPVWCGLVAEGLGIEY